MLSDLLMKHPSCFDMYVSGARRCSHGATIFRFVYFHTVLNLASLVWFEMNERFRGVSKLERGVCEEFGL